MTIMVFDIETIPDIASYRKLLDLAVGMDDVAVAKQVFAARKEATGSEFLPQHMHRIVTISVVVATNTEVKVWSLGDLESDEADLISRFFAGLDRYIPTLVSWNGSGFDLPVLHYRSLLHGIVAAKYWDTGGKDPSFKWNNYLGRYQQRHTDVMDVLAGYQPRANAPLDEIAVMLGLPGKMGVKGSAVWQKYCNGELSIIRDYCETDVLNTYLVFLRFELIRGNITQEQYHNSCDLLREVLLADTEKLHLKEFANAWLPTC
ncbi:MAG: 3'-5' exonuclease [Legionellales bacterium]|nr:MAG: 3'-5' exonuclease [Legionellales bacterium]